MKSYLLRFVAVTILTSAFGGASIAQGIFAQKGKVAHWGIFQDDKYCWIATNFDPTGRAREMVLMVDSDSKVFIQLNHPAKHGNEKWESILLRTSKTTFPFKEKNGWGVYPEKNQSSVRKNLLASSQVLFEGSFVVSGDRFGVKGYFRTGKGEQAYRTMLETCA